VRRGRRRTSFGVLALALLVAPGVMAPSASARLMFATSETADVPVIDLATGTLSATVEGVGRDSVAVAIAPDGRRAYVPSFESDDVSVIDTTTDAVVTTIALPANSDPVGIAISPDGREAYVVESEAAQVAVIDTATDAVSRSIPLAPGSGPRPIAISPDGGRAYVGEVETGEVAVIDTATGTVGGTISLPSGSAPPLGFAITPDGRHLYSVGLGAGEVTVIDTATDSVGATVTLPSSLGGFEIAIAPDGRRAYVPESGAGEVAVIDTATDAVVKSIPLGSTGGLPYDVAIAPDGRRAYVTSVGKEEIAVLDTADDEALAPIEVPGEHPVALAIVPAQPPTAALAPAAGLPGRPVTFDASASADPEGGSLTYDWDFGDGTGAADAGPTPSHVYSAPGTYRATVDVDDGEGCPGFAFTGQTASCNGSSVARATTAVHVSGPTAAVTPPGPASAPPSAQPAFLLRKVTGNPGNGTVRLRLRLSGAGTLRVRGASVRPIHRAVAEARTLTVVVRPTRKAMKALHRHGALRVRLRIAFKPATGIGREVSRTVALRRRARA
jgi:YVTN family beta-propeller protein